MEDYHKKKLCMVKGYQGYKAHEISLINCEVSTRLPVISVQSSSSRSSCESSFSCMSCTMSSSCSDTK